MGNLRKFLAVFTFLSLFVVGSVMSQNTFKVLANKGSNTFSATGSNWQPIKTGATLNGTDQVKVGEGSYLGLMHSSGRTVELKTAGIKNLKDVLSGMESSKSSVASKYADFVLSKMNQSEEDINRNHRNYLSATGAVTRGANSPIKLFLPSSVDVYSEQAAIKWTEVADIEDATYKVTVYNMFDEVVMETETSDLGTMLDFSDEKLASERMVIVKVSLADDEEVFSDKYAIKRMDLESNEAVITELKELETMTEEKTAMNMLIMASFYEQNNLLVDALSYYQAAIELAPEVDIFRHAYEQFVVSNALGTK